MADYKKIRIVDQSGTQLEEVNVKDETARNELAKKIRHYTATVNAATSSEIMRITDSTIDTNTVVLMCRFASPGNITTNVSWVSYNGYISFTGTSAIAQSAEVVLGQKGN